MILTRPACFLALIAGSIWSRASTIDEPRTQSTDQVFLDNKPPSVSFKIPDKHESESDEGIVTTATVNSTLRHAINALEVMQCHFYELWIGTWPTAIDWTAAVLSTYVSASLSTIVRSTHRTQNYDHEAVVNKYFSQSTAFYFGQDSFGIRNEAYDDMLWVVLGWLENIRFTQYQNKIENSWYGTQFIPGFSHRARLFWDLASRGWDDTLCGGGMLWNPNLLPYKNAITNQLFISASVAMYLYSPGDSIDFPFMAHESASMDSPHDPKHLLAAIRGYAWLKNSNMTNSQGLYVDGYHIRGLTRNGNRGSGKCDERNEMVYTYNQGVILSGLRGLWEATGDVSYLEDGYKLTRNVMASTGWTWSGTIDSPILETVGWSGLGQDGILEEFCDSSGSCSQDSQTFKGIYFQHLTQFCESLPEEAMVPGKTYGASERVRNIHTSVCKVVGTWVLHNAKAALKTKDKSGLFGMWWRQGHATKDTQATPPAGALDYRNNATLLTTNPWAPAAWPRKVKIYAPTLSVATGNSQSSLKRPLTDKRIKAKDNDPNDRGRGRTVETQGGGLSVLRSAWELQNLPQT